MPPPLLGLDKRGQAPLPDLFYSNASSFVYQFFRCTLQLLVQEVGKHGRQIHTPVEPRRQRMILDVHLGTLVCTSTRANIRRLDRAAPF